MTKTDAIDPNKLSGILLILAALAALIINNSALAPLYDGFFATKLSVAFGDFGLDKPLLLWINDGLMAIFFFLIGLEIKREVLVGELSTRKQAILPIVAAIGGIVFPALIYTSLNIGDSYNMRGWGVPVATDIAFALGVLALIGTGLPKELKILLLSLAIIDDVAAIIIIALFYTDNLSLIALTLASIGMAAAIGLNIAGVKKIAPYILIGIFMWVCVLKSGVHATLAGVLLAFCIPMTNEKNECPVETLEHGLHPWVFFLIMPLFAFANAGVDLKSFSVEGLLTPITLGIFLGLFVGKQIGVFSFIWLGTKLGLCQKPEATSWLQLYGLSILTGIGFTMSLFIGTLAYDAPDTMTQIRIGVLGASFLSAILAYSILKLTLKK